MAIMYTTDRDIAECNSYENAVLAKVVDQSYRIMSDVWGTADFALVWDEATASPKQILVNVYDMQGYNWVPTKIIVDATPEVRAAYEQWLVNVQFNHLVSRAEDAAREIEKGAIAKVVKGRNAQGTQGKVVVKMKATYGMGWQSRVLDKLGIATSDVMFKKALSNGKVVDAHRDMIWVWAHNCQRVDVAPVDKDALLEQAKAWAARELSARAPALQAAA